MGVHYVDDLLLVAPDNILEETSKALEEKFTLATPGAGHGGESSYLLRL